MSVLFLIPNSSGGAEKVSINYANILAHSGFSVTVLLIRTQNDKVELSTYISHKNIFVVDYNWKGVFKSSVGLIKYIVKNKPDFVFSSLTTFSILAVVASFFARNIKVIARQCFTPGTESTMLEFCLSRFLRYAYINVAQTPEMRQQMIASYKFAEDNVVSIYNPLNKSDILAKTKGIKRNNSVAYQFVSIGRVSPDKDYVTLLKAFNIVHQHHPESRLTIIGNNYKDSYYCNLIRLIQQYGLTESVAFIEYTSNPYQYMLSNDCLVLSSIREGLPNVVLEAMFLNVPVVATESVPFITENIKEGINGYRCKVGDYVQLAEKMMLAPKLKGKISNKDVSGGTEKQIIKLFTV